MEWQTILLRNCSWEALELKHQALVSEVKLNPNRAFFLISEPLPTFTYGRNASSSGLIWNFETLQKNKITMASVTRGGKWTYHGPGQVVLYPLVHLPTLGYDSRATLAFIEDLRAGTVNALNELGLADSSPGEPFGIYVNQSKLVSFGLAFSRAVATNGLALYLEDQSFYFSGINPCGVEGALPTSLAKHLNPLPSWDSVANSLTTHIKKRFSLPITQVG